MTGVSGSGKSSLAFDTLYAEGQRRYVESLSSYARQFLGQMPKPEVDAISGLSPSISIQQKTSGRNPRSTVGTITEIYDYLRVLYARVGVGHCPKCNREITAQSTEQIIESIAHQSKGTRFQILAPLVQNQKGEYKDLFEDLLKRGYLRARVDGNVVQLTDDLQLDRQMKHTIEVVVDRLVAGKTGRSRLAEAVENALKLADGTLIVAKRSNEQTYSSRYACTHCTLGFESPGPQLFSFNSPLGMCQDCNGLGMRHDFLVDRLVPNGKLSLSRGAIPLVGKFKGMGRWRRHVYKGVATHLEKKLKLKTDSLIKTAWKDLPSGDDHITFSWGYRGGTWKHGGEWDGFVPELLEDYRKSKNPMRRKQLEKYMEVLPCPSCKGGRLNTQAGGVRLWSAFSNEVCALSIADAAKFFEHIVLDGTRMVIADEVLKEIRGRLGFLLKCGLDYLTLNRTAPTLSGGESQRIRLAGQIGCGLVGVVYILDEPSIGLHPRDNELLLESLCDLRDQGNTVIVVEHDEETMRAADYMVDFGPGPGVRGGEIVAKGSYSEITKAKRSLTGQYLSGKLTIDIPERRKAGKNAITIKGAEHNNLKKVDVAFPLGQFICVTGVSGSGKSSLVNDILWQVLNSQVNGGNGKPGKHTRVNGLQHIDKAIDIDQRAIGRTPRSNPATYIKIFDVIRDLFTKLPESKIRAYKPGRFSFNVAAGRCEACEGYGSNKLEMDFLADVWVTCPVCEGQRFNRETLEVRFKGKNIADVLGMDINEAIEHFANIPRILKLLQTLKDVGLDYLKLGQPSPTLSGGEAQRIKLARELGKRSTGKTVYLLDEPTTGLHFADVSKLLDVLHNFVNEGNTVIVVEHNLDVIKTADHLIDLGPEGGVGGGKILVQGTPEKVAACKQSHTGKALKLALKPARSAKNGAQRRKSKRTAEAKTITVRGAAQHNLQKLDVEIPRNRMSVFCGPSGSGKTSLAMDTLYAEGQRRYVESLSSYARQFLGQMPKPRVEHIHGLSPSIAIEQKTVGSSPRSTVGTVTEIYDYLRILFARLGTPYCPDCQTPIETQTTDMVIDRILDFPEKSKLLLLAPQDVEVGKSYELLWDKLRGNGFTRVRIDGEVVRLDAVPAMDRKRRHQVEIVVDRITVSKRSRPRIADSVEAALDLGKGFMHVAVVDDTRAETDWKTINFSLHYSCRDCGRSFEELTPHNFSFNSWLGWCDACEGLGTEYGTELSLLINDPNISLMDAAIAAWPDPKTNKPFQRMLKAIGDTFQIPLDIPFRKLEPGQQRLILQGTGDRWVEDKKAGFSFQYKGLYPAIDEASRVSYSYRRSLQEHVGEVPCSACNASRLRDDAAAVRLNNMTIGQLCESPLDEALGFLKSLKLSASEKKIAGDLLTEATSRLSFLVEVGLTYITLSRPLPTLSGGECQRIRLAGQIGRALTGVLYVLDEPTIGLHPRDNDRLLKSLQKLRDLDNTLVLVEHDREVLNAADHLYDFGPGAGRFGGTVVGHGTPKQLAKSKKSLTGEFLSGRKDIAIPTERRVQRLTPAERKALNATKPDGGNPLGSVWSLPPGGGWLQLKGARLHNLRNVDLRIPLGTMTVVTGVSGSGKSSLIENTLARSVANKLHRSTESPGPYDELLGIDQVNKIIVVDQQPLGSTPASNPATYTGVFQHIRELFTQLPDAKVRGYRPGRFSFNRAGGRCDDCEGLGQKCIEMHFLPDVWVECETCRGKRYNQETLSVQYRGQSIADVLEMSIGESFKLFENIPKIRSYLATLVAVGLDYLTLGQSAPTLSGGEAQRVKLASELARPNTGKTLYVLDEPTTGLHFDDIAKLLKVLNSLVEQGNTVVVIEHNLDVIKTADWLIDMGPEAGNEGGWIIKEGTPEFVCKTAPKKTTAGTKNGKANGKTRSSSKAKPTVSHTAIALAPILKTGKRLDREIFDVHEAARKKEGDLDLKQFGRGAKMPWQKDGRQWHTNERVSHNGKACKWDGAALAMVIDLLGDTDGLSEVNWNDRSVVEITGPTKKDGWLLHALTGDEWLLTLNFRVKRNTFKEEALREQINLKTLDDIDEIHHYSSTERVRVRNLKGPWQQVTIRAHTMAEIDTQKFKAFVKKASESFIALTTKAALNIDDLTPWKVLGKKWHLSRKGFPSNKRVAWDATIIEKLADAVTSAAPKTIIDWTGKQIVTVQHPGSGTPAAKIMTKRRGGIDLVIPIADGQVAMGRIASFGDEQEVRKTAKGTEEVLIRFTKKNQISPKLKSFLAETLS
ncbi:UNVERIFIED_CONTAM: hypothetical protein GTU68_044007 [Idotea baltica]|nr:hypothetical protein [Idotea baltica]